MNLQFHQVKPPAWVLVERSGIVTTFEPRRFRLLAELEAGIKNRLFGRKLVLERNER